MAVPLVRDAIALDRNRRGFYHPPPNEHGQRGRPRHRVLRILLAPALIGAASLAGRRWGPAVSGWLVGLPLTSAPVTFLLALEHGPSFAAQVALGTLAGTVSQILFAVVYAWLARRHGWVLAFGGGSLAFGVSTAALAGLHVPLAALGCAVVVVLVLGLRAIPTVDQRATAAAAPLPHWDLPVRMLAATLIVGVLVGGAPALGPHFTGMLSPFPVYAAILTVFAHRGQGAPAAIGVLRGLLAGLFGFVGFFVVVAGSIERVGIAAAFIAATVVALTAQLVSLRALRPESS
jgi:hypothetical protein